MNQTRYGKQLCAIALAAGLLACAAYAEGPPDKRWVNPCVGGVSCNPLIPEFCWCTADWDDAGVWEYLTPCNPTCPDSGSHLLQKSNIGYCDGGTYDELPCSGVGDCPGGSCEDVEKRLDLYITNETIGYLEIRTEATEATTDKLNVYIYSAGTGAKTLTIGMFVVDGTGGPATVKILGATGIQTTN